MKIDLLSKIKTSFFLFDGIDYTYTTSTPTNNGKYWAFRINEVNILDRNNTNFVCVMKIYESALTECTEEQQLESVYEIQDKQIRIGYEALRNLDNYMVQSNVKVQSTQGINDINWIVTQFEFTLQKCNNVAQFKKDKGWLSELK